MKSRLHKAWCAIAASLVTLMNSAFTDQQNSAQMRNLENRVSALEQRRGANGVINPNGNVQVKNSNNVFFSAAFLCWQARENGLEFAVKNDHGTTFINQGKMKSPATPWQYGVRGGIGYHLPHDGWDLYLMWTYFNSNSTRRVESDAGGILFPVNANPNAAIGSSVTAVSAHNHFKMTLQQGDLQTGREFYVSKWLMVRPHMGLRGSMIRERFNTDFQGGTVVQRSQKETEHWRENYKGIGTALGFNTTWGVGQGISLFCDGDVALLYGFFKVRETEKLQTPDKVLYAVNNFFHLTRPVTDLAIGMKYDRYFNDDQYHFRFQIGWENHVYYGLNQYVRPVDQVQAGSFVSNLGDLTFQGWSFEARFDF